MAARYLPPLTRTFKRAAAAQRSMFSDREGKKMRDLAQHMQVR